MSDQFAHTGTSGHSHSVPSHAVQVLERMKADTAEEHRPRVLGLSASLVNQSDKSLERFEHRIEELKVKLMAELTTARDMAEV